MLVPLFVWVLSLSLQSCAGIHSQSDSYDGPNITEVVDLLDILNQDKDDLLVDLSQVSTLCDVSASRIKRIQDIGIPRLQLDNQQQNEFIDNFRAQVKDIIHDADAALAECEATSTLGLSSQDSLSDQMGQVSEINATNEAQDKQMDDLTDDLVLCQEAFVEALSISVQGLNDSLLNVSKAVQTVEDFVESRHCEQGLTVVFPGENVTVDFKTVYDEVPDISVNVVGFNAHLGTLRGYGDDLNLLALYKVVVNESISGFTIDLGDDSTNDVDLKYVYYNWQACQHLDDNVSV